MSGTVTLPALRANTDALRAFWRALVRPGDVHEARAPKTRGRWYGTVSGYFNAGEAFVSALSHITGAEAEAVYLTLNPVNPALLARAANRLKVNAKETSTDTDIVKRTTLLVDSDPVRPSGISSTDAERDAALALRDIVRAYLTDEAGWPEPLAVTMSGNGGALLYRVDLPNDAEATALVERVLKALADLFDTPTVKVDTTNSNAARITKIVGTVAAKGDNLLDRPWRLAVGSFTPDAPPVPREALERVASLAPEPKRHAAGASGDGAGERRWDLRELLTRAGIGWREKAKAGYTVLQLERCLTSQDHADGAALFEFASGAVAYRCLHNRCSSKRWADVRGVLGSGRVGERRATLSQVEILDAESDTPDAPVLGLHFPELAWRGPFATYREAMRGATHAPEEALFAGLWAAGAACLGRRARFYLGMDVYPNVALAIFGETGDGKTTAARHGVDRLHALTETVGVLRGSGSGEGVVDWLRDPKESHLWFAEEYSEILIRAGWDGATIKSVIVNLYDCPPEYELRFRKDKTPVKVERPTLNLLVCTTPATFWKYLHDEDFDAGFGNRWLYVAGTKRPVIPRPVRPDGRFVSEVDGALGELARLRETECRMDAEAARLWDEFYQAWDAEPWTPLVRVAVKRVPQYVLKLAMLYAAFEGTLHQLTADQIQAAILVGHYAARCTATLMHDLKPGGFRGRLETRILQIVTSTPLPPYKIKRQVGGGVSVEDVDRAIKALERAGELERVGQTTQGRPVWGRRGVSYGK